MQIVVTNPSLLRGVDEVHGDVGGLDEASECVVGDEGDRVSFDESIIDPQTAAE